MKTKIREIYGTLLDIMTVSGFAARNAEKVRDAVLSYTKGFFAAEDVSISAHGSVTFERKPLGESGGTLLIDAHIDTVGMAVSEILPGGFLACTNSGGIDSRILPSLAVRIHGKGETIKGVFCSVPPHLSGGKEPKAPKMSELYIDTGRSTAELEKICPVGTPISYVTETVTFAAGEGERICSPYLDDKICATAAIAAISELSCADLKCGVILNLSANEETNGEGALRAAERKASAALVLDVNFACGKGVPEYVCAPIGEGVSISYSSATSRRLTKLLEDTLVREGLPFKRIIETCDTGTDATRLAFSRFATPCAVMSVPISYMHTPCECASLSDAEVMAKAVSAFAGSFCADGVFEDRHYIKRLAGGEA